MTATGAQLEHARELLGWTRGRLARAAGVSPSTVYKAERDAPRPSDWAQTAIRQALENAGAEFIEENGGTGGVRVRRRN